MIRIPRTAVAPPGLRRAASLTTLALLGAAAGTAPAAATAAVPGTQPLVVLQHDRVARTAPDAGARRITTIAARRPLTRVRTILPVVGLATGSDGRSWVRVRLPGRPNGRKGWIPAVQMRPASTDWHISIDLSERRVTVRRGGRIARRFRASVGTRATPTPVGRFFVEEAVALSARDSGAPFALATSARSNVLQEFAGGPGQIALHGIANLSGALGTAISHGCVRLSTRAITWLARRIGAGVPLTVTR